MSTEPSVGNLGNDETGIGHCSERDGHIGTIPVAVVSTLYPIGSRMFSANQSPPTFNFWGNRVRNKERKWGTRLDERPNQTELTLFPCRAISFSNTLLVHCSHRPHTIKRYDIGKSQCAKSYLRNFCAAARGWKSFCEVENGCESKKSWQYRCISPNLWDR